MPLLEVLPAMVPQDAEEVKRWLKGYMGWREEVLSMGYYSVPSDIGTKVQSNRQGRPTERTAILLTTLLGQCKTVERWLKDMCPLERRLADYHLHNCEPDMGILADELNLPYVVVKGITLGLPHLIWSRTYTGLDE